MQTMSMKWDKHLEGRPMTLLAGFVLVLAIFMAGAALAEPPGSPGERLVKFRGDASLGALKIRDWDSAADEWKDLGPAKGEIRVPAQKALRLEISKQSAAGLPGLSEVDPTALQALVVQEVRLDSGLLTWISRLAGIDSLRIEKCNLADSDLDVLKPLRGLRELSLSQTLVTDDGLKSMKGFKTLEDLDLSHTRVSDAGLKHVGSLTRLIRLNLSETKVTGDGLKHLSKLSALRTLKLPPTVSPDQIACLKGIPAYEPLAERRPFRLRVVDKAGKGIPAAEVALRFPDNEVKTVTDADGRCACNLPKGKLDYLEIKTSQEGCVPMKMTWRSAADNQIPEEFLIEMDPGTTIGGIIVNEDGQPVKGATVSLLVPSNEDQKPRPAIWDYRVTTDERGKWQSDIMPSKLDDVWIKLSHADYVSDPMYGSTPKPPMDKLRDMTGQMVMKRGVTVAGRVADKEGKPVAGASVVQGQDRWGSDYPETRTDADGMFSFKNSKPGAEMVLTVQKDSYSPDMRRVDVSKDMGEVSFALEKGRTLRGRVVDKDGKPLSDTMVVADTWRACRAISWETRTDSEGCFVWNSAPADEVACEILKRGYMDVRRKPLVAGDEEAVITLTAPLRISGAVVDAQTGQPVVEFKVLRGITWNPGQPVSWERRESIQGRDGKYVAEFTYPRPGHVLRVEADGYLPAISRTFKSDEETQMCDFKLEKGKPLAGVVRGPDGAPLARAEVVLCTPAAGLFLENGQLNERRESRVVESDAEGRFSFPAEADPYVIAVIHDAGYAETSKEAFEKNPEITVQAWGRVEGTLRIGFAPGSDQPVLLSYERPWDPQTPRVSFQYQLTTDKAGSFAFERVVPGAVRVYRGIKKGDLGMAYSHGVYADVVPGQTVHAQVGGTGRPVKGRIAIPVGFTQEINWQRGELRINSNPPKIQPPEDLSTEEKRAWYTKWQESPEGKAYERARASYAFVVQSDGAFVADDVPAGSYTLNVQLNAAPPSGQCGWGELIGTATKEFKVPAIPGGRTDEPLDIGTIDLKEAVKIQHLKLGEPVPAFAAKTVDGKPLKLADFRGRYVLLDFWATWCGPCRGETAAIKAVHSAYASHPKFALISLSLDESPDDPKKYAQENDMKWTQGFLGEWKKTDVPTQYGVEGIPAIFLIDPEGKLVAENLRGDAILKAVKNALE
jgi:thiol-disulfide isomerase/thioredoxin